MAFIDELKIHLSAGRGGNGVVRWLHEKGREFGGPAGGNGGRGGNVYAVAVRDIGALSRYRSVKEIAAGAGSDGGSFGRHGKTGRDVILYLPVGSVLFNYETNRRVELLKEGDKVLLLSGGRGGLGNKYFKSSTNTRPRQWTSGEAGEEADFYIELQMIADAGLIGLPNAGKTSLLNALTNALGVVGDYAFTTLEPNLGNFHGFILADLPGLIEGASAGKGLGYKFLRHIRRTKFLLHLISLESKNPLQDYGVVREELRKFDQMLLAKREIIVLSKTDLVSRAVVAGVMKIFSEKEVLTVSVNDTVALKRFSSQLSKILSAG
jgi:GTP-binding protein